MRRASAVLSLMLLPLVFLIIGMSAERESHALTLDPVPVLGNSSTWSTTITTDLGLYLTRSTQYGQRDRVIIRRPYVSITYRARIVNADTGEIIPPSGSVLEGTSLRLEFEPHYSQDVYWTTTGFGWDTPYGDWSANAAAPPISCQEKDFVGTQHTVEWGPYPYDLYVALMADPPKKTLSGTSGLACASPGANGNVSCTASKAGQVNPVFSFKATTGKFYGRVDMSSFGGSSCLGTNYPFGAGEKAWEDPYYSISGPITPELLYQFNDYFIEPYTLSVQQVDIPYPITIVDAEGDPPTKPTVSAGGACVVGSPHVLTLTATDPDNDDVKYGVDWDANGTVDQFAPSSGYVSSGTAQTVSRTYATGGSKRVKVIALDENGLTSNWTTFTFSCTDPGKQSEGQGSGLGDGNGDGGGGGDSGATPNLTIRAVPSLVRSGETTSLHWSASNVTACTVSGSNGDSFTGTISAEPAGNESASIEAQTTYTLSCTDADDNVLTQSTTVNILPIFSEN